MVSKIFELVSALKMFDPVLILATEAVSLKKLAVMKKSVESILNILIKLTVFIFF